MKILIVGGGIAGCTLAYFLKKNGFNPVIVEAAPEFRRVGYLLVLRETGLKILDIMGIGEEVKKHQIEVKKTIWVGENGKKVANFSVGDLQKEYGSMALNRADLHAELFDLIKKDTDFRFSQSVKHIVQKDNAAVVTFSNNKKETFDLVVGADGFHSQVREMVFGSNFERFLHSAFFAFIIPNRIKSSIPSNHEVVTVRSKQFFISYGGFSCLGDEIGGYVIYRTEKDTDIPVEKRKQYLLDNFGDFNESFKKILESLKDTDFTYHDSLTQIVMPTWHKGSVVLIGDASHCLTLASGMGASLAMADAYVLAKSLADTKSVDQAIALYEKTLVKEADRLQKYGQKMAKFFTSGSLFNYDLLVLALRFIPAPIVTRYMLSGSENRLQFE